MQDLWAIARYDLGLTTDDFGELTPALFEALIERRKAESKQDYFRTGLISAAVINTSMAAPKTPVSAMDFVPGDKPKPKDLTTMDPEEAAATVLAEMSKKIERRVS